MSSFLNKLKACTLDPLKARYQSVLNEHSNLQTQSSSPVIHIPLPWDNCSEPVSIKIKSRVVELCKDINKVKKPHQGETTCHFQIDSNKPLLFALLEAIPELKSLRMWMVPQRMSEEVFWSRMISRIYDIRQEELDVCIKESVLEELVDELGDISDGDDDVDIDEQLQFEIDQALAASP
ncbi:hypothetical protein RCL1_007255 [Eukaryota sp. TZLM3-RCL]